MSKIAIDINPMVHRAWAIAESKPGEGTAEDRLRGMIKHLLQEFTPTHGAAAVDYPSFRYDFFPEYKAGRPARAQGLVDLLKGAPEVFRSEGIEPVGVPTYEADDVIASLVHRVHGLIVVSSDKDFFQFFGVNGCRQWDPMKKNATEDNPDAWPGGWVTEADVFKKFQVYTPDEVLAVQTIMGDSVDKIPGCPKIGLVGASELVTAFGSVDGVYEALQKGALTGRLAKYAKHLESGRDDVRMSRRLVTLVTDLDVNVRPIRAQR